MAITSGRWWTVWALGVALVAAPACSGPAGASGDTGKKAKNAKPAEPPPKRSYDNPNVPTTDTELDELDRLCEAALECHKTRCNPDEQARIFKKVSMKSAWGKALQKHCAGNPIAGVGRRLAKLSDVERLGQKSRACREVSARFD